MPIEFTSFKTFSGLSSDSNVAKGKFTELGI